MVRRNAARAGEWIVHAKERKRPARLFIETHRAEGHLVGWLLGIVEVQQVIEDAEGAAQHGAVVQAVSQANPRSNVVAVLTQVIHHSNGQVDILGKRNAKRLDQNGQGIFWILFSENHHPVQRGHE